MEHLFAILSLPPEEQQVIRERIEFALKHRISDEEWARNFKESVAQFYQKQEQWRLSE